jgi:hypothetical protein
MTSTRVRACLLAVAVAMSLGGCSSDDDPKKATDSGLLKVSDMPFEDATTDDLPRPPVLSQLGTTCLGLEQGGLYDAGWKVDARQFYDSSEWTVISAVFTPPEGTSAEEGLDEAQAAVEACAPKESAARIKPLDLGGSTYAYEVTTPRGEFNAARAYKPLPDGKLAQVSVMKLPEGKDATAVLKDLVDDLD